jgi:molecular chaperone DnaJ
VRGRGSPGERGGASGDLEVTVHVLAHPVFGREGNNLTLTVPVKFSEATLGASVKIPTVDGAPLTLKVPPGTSNGQRLRVRGRGVPRGSGGGGGSTGDLIVTIEIVVPRSSELSPKARKALQEFAAEDQSDPRSILLERMGDSL